jgi:hypothetical protein
MVGGNTFCLGVLMLDNGFPRPVGDIGNPESFPFQVIYDRVPGAQVEKVVTGHGLAPALVADFAARAVSLEKQGCDLITTGCGFLLPHQIELSAAVAVPVVTSALCVLPYLRALRPAHRRIGILTYDGPKLAATLGPDALQDLEIQGIEGGRELHGVIAEDRATLDIAAARDDVRNAAQGLVDRVPDLYAVVMECTNLPPYRDAVEEVLACPVYDIRDLVHWHAGLARPQ